MKNKNGLLIPFIVVLVSSVMLFSSIFLPYISATEEYSEAINSMGDVQLYEDSDITFDDMEKISMVEYVGMFKALGKGISVDEAQQIVSTVLVVLIGGFSLLTVLFALLKKPIPLTIFSVLAFIVFCINNFDFSDRGVAPNDKYSWGIAYYIFYIAFVVAIAGAIWLMVAKIKVNKTVIVEE